MMSRLLLMVGFVALVLALAMTGALSLLRVDEVVEVFPLPAEVLDLPLPTEPAPDTAAPALTPAPTAAGPTAGREEPTTIVLQAGRDGYEGCSDTYIQLYRPTQNYCASSELSLVTSNKATTLLRFDLTRLPDNVTRLNAGATILQATLELYALQGNKDTVMGIYLPRGVWDPCTLTWNNPWETPGADGPADREQEAWVDIAAKRATGWLEFDVTGLVQRWLNEPTQNLGMILKSLDASAPAHFMFVSSEHPGQEERPRLTIRYEPALPAPTGSPRSEPTQANDSVPTITSTSSPAATPTLIVPLSPRVVEIHWRNEMDVGGTYPVRVIFRPETGQATSSLSIYLLNVYAQVTAPTFEVVENAPLRQLLEQPEDTLSWSWQVEPRVLGAQTLAVDLLFDWRLASGGSGATMTERGAWYQTKVIRVTSPFRYRSQVVLLRGLLAAMGLVCLMSWGVLKKRTKGRPAGN